MTSKNGKNNNNNNHSDIDSMHTFPFDLRIGIVCVCACALWFTFVYSGKLYELMQIAIRSKSVSCFAFTLARSLARFDSFISFSVSFFSVIYFMVGCKHTHCPHAARMTAHYEAGNIPFISSDAIGAKFSFKTIRFLCNHRASKIQQPIEKCSSSSSSSVVDRTIAMEMQLLAENGNHAMPMRFLIFSWFFVVASDRKSKNYSLEPLIKCLKFIRRPNTMKTIKKPFPLDRIVYESAGDYYGHNCAPPTELSGDTNESESYHQLIEANHLIPIGITQMREFHKLAHHIEGVCTE